MASVLNSFSQELAAAAEQAGPSVVTVHARHRVPSSGIYWRKGIVVTANHTVRREDDIALLAHDGKRVAARLAGRDPGTDLAALKFDQDDVPAIPQFADAASLKLANFVLALGRTRLGNLVASAGIIGGFGGEWRTWRGGRIDQNIRLDLALYPGFSGRPLVDVEGKVLGINTSGFGRGRAVTIPVSTVNRVVDELLDKGYIARPYLGIAMQPVAVPEGLRGKLKSSAAGGLMVLHVEAGGPADKAGIVLGDVIVELGGKPALDTDRIQDLLASTKVNEKIGATIIRGGMDEILPAIQAAYAGMVLLDAETTQTLAARIPTPAVQPAPALDDLTPREVEVLRMLAEGLGNRETAGRLGISDHTVKFHVSSILDKLGASTRTEAVTMGIRMGIILV